MTEFDNAVNTLIVSSITSGDAAQIKAALDVVRDLHDKAIEAARIDACVKLNTVALEMSNRIVRLETPTEAMIEIGAQALQNPEYGMVVPQEQIEATIRTAYHAMIEASK